MREGGREGGRERGSEGEREGRREGVREREREVRREGGNTRFFFIVELFHNNRCKKIKTYKLKLTLTRDSTR